jgi:hypothetical protein
MIAETMAGARYLASTTSISTPQKRNPISAEWRDSEGNLLFAAYYNYEMDSFRNWTYRQVWVWTPDLGDRALYETDFRGIAYWQK